MSHIATEPIVLPENQVCEEIFQAWARKQARHIITSHMEQMKKVAFLSVRMVNPKQYMRIFIRRSQNLMNPMYGKRHVHIGRHLHAVVHARDLNGKFLAHSASTGTGITSPASVSKGPADPSAIRKRGRPRKLRIDLEKELINTSNSSWANIGLVAN